MEVKLEKENLERLKKIELEILGQFIDICQRNNLKYSLAFGSMIGCIRHKGFIPWDDDIDVIMPIEDYNRFLEIAQSELGNEYFLQYDKTDKGYRFPYAKIRKNNTCVVNPLSHKYGYSHRGIYMDIFPVKYLPRNKFIQKLQSISLTIIGHIITTFCIEIVNMGRTPMQRFAKLILFFMSKLLPYKFLLWLHDIITDIGTNENSDYLCCYCSEEMGFMEKYTFEKDIFNDLILKRFEQYDCYMPREYDKIMKHIYGDYMAIPKEKKTHQFQFVGNDITYEEYIKNKYKECENA